MMSVQTTEATLALSASDLSEEANDVNFKVGQWLTERNCPPVVDVRALSKHGDSFNRVKRTGSFVRNRRSSDVEAVPVSEGNDVLAILSNTSIQLRSHMESWGIPRSQLKMFEKLGAGAGSEIFRCRWRGLDCAAKVTNHLLYIFLFYIHANLYR